VSRSACLLVGAGAVLAPTEQQASSPASALAHSHYPDSSWRDVPSHPTARVIRIEQRAWWRPWQNGERHRLEQVRVQG